MIVATAGHVDHGKTSLVGQLTGVDTDRLEEEKRRGLSINLGFAYRCLDAETSIGFVDVPGHTRFINTMIAGVSGIDLGMLIVAADDGPMPQTVEHLDVMRLLGVSRFIIVVTKIDRVADARVQEVKAAALALLSEGCTDREYFEGEEASGRTRLFEVSNVDGSGVEMLRRFLDEQARLFVKSGADGADGERKVPGGFFRMSIDRAFVLKGTGLVATGTALSGRVSVGDTLQLLPQNLMVRVRAVHAQDQAGTCGDAGQRCALNIAGNVTRDTIARGDCLVDTGCGSATLRVDTRVHLLKKLPFALKHMLPVKVYIGAKRLAAKLFLIERGEEGAVRALQPGGEALVQLVCDEAISCCRGDRFLLRDDSESITLGGGIVLDPFAKRQRKTSQHRLSYLAAMEKSTAVQALSALLIDAGQVVDFGAFRQSWNLREDEGEALLRDELISQRVCDAASSQGLLLSTEHWQHLQQDLSKTLQAWHAEHSADQGISPGAFKALLAQTVHARLCDTLIATMVRNGALSLQGGLLRLSGFKVQVSDEARQQWLQLEALLNERGLQIPLVSELAEDSGLAPALINKVLRGVVKGGQLHAISEKRFALPQTLNALAAHVASVADAQASFSVIDCKKKFGLGRNLTIELLEYFDAIRYTQRRGNVRVLLNAKVAEQFVDA